MSDLRLGLAFFFAVVISFSAANATKTQNAEQKV